MTFIRICWAINGFILLIALYFFLDGLRSATNENYFSAWAPIFGALFVGLPVSYWFYQVGHSTIATVVASIPASFAAILGLFFILTVVVILISGENFRWN